MELELSAEEAALRDNVRTVLAATCPRSVVRAVHDGQAPPAALWEQLVELGWPALAIDEEHGGLGLGFVELSLVAEELGRAAAPTPLLATTTQYVPAIRELGGAEAARRFLPQVAAGERTGTLAWADGPGWSLDSVGLSAVRAPGGDDWVLDGRKVSVVDGASADEIAVIARADAGIGAFVVPREALVVSSRPTIDPTIPLADLRFDAVVVSPDRVLALPGAGHVEAACARVMECAAVALAASTVGTCRVIFESTLEYAKVREQFDRPIGAFQALKHRLVDAYLAVERATALVYYAALTIAEDAPDRAVAAAAAKAAAGDCQRLLSEEGLQLHGGIGFTWEHDLHFFLKRAKSGEALFGGAVMQRASLAQALGLVGAGGSA